MCKNESHNGLTQPEHFTRHAMSVNQLRAMAKSGLREIAPDAALIDAQEALSLADDGVSIECVRMLQCALKGDLLSATS